MVHKAAVFQLFSFVLVCPFTTVQATAESRSCLSSPDTPAARDVLRSSEEASGLPAKREPLVDVLLHGIRDDLPSVKEIESFIESAISRPVEKRQPRRKRPSSNNNNNNNNSTNSTQDDDESAANGSAAMMHISLALSAVLLAGFLQL
ncbi:hypothetical protein F4809DRAFT_353762 [Biscogniauxia mediterranea]|nr:hypothetical protein F4809DRAFT_353762 [Biscogniauxia mediterranea]